MSGGTLIDTLRLTLNDPRRGMRAVLSWPLGASERLGLMVAMAILNVLCAEALAAQLPELPEDAMSLVLGQPFLFAAMQLFGLFVMSGLVHAVGRAFGGQGSFAGAQMAILWLHVLFLILQLVQILALALAPPLALVLSYATLAAALWFLPQFVAEVHGFRSAGLTFLGILATILAIMIVLGLVLALTLPASLEA